MSGNRKSIRLKGSAYYEPGYFFITIKVSKNLKVLGKIDNGVLILNPNGHIVENQLLKIASLYDFIKIDHYIIMPDHIHFILTIESYNNISISSVIGSFKSCASKKIRMLGIPDFKWERSFYDRIIRDDRELYFIMEYIEKNPANYGDKLGKDRRRLGF